MSKYTIVSTVPTTYNDPTEGVVNGVLVRFRIEDYQEVHEVRVPKLDVKLVKQAIEEAVKQRDDIAALTSPTTK